MSRPEAEPGPWAAVWLTLAATFTAQLLALVMVGPTPSPGAFATALGLGFAVGYGGLGTLVARQLPPPADVRLGLRGCSPAFLVPILLLVPGVLLASELDNVAKALFPPPPPPPADPAVPPLLSVATPLDLLQNAVLVVGLAPVLLEWFFRGVLQQGLVAHLGRVGGVVLAALLSAIATTAPLPSFPIWLAALAASFLFGLGSGCLRLVSGSLVPAIALQMALGACDVFGRAYADRLPIPGFNAPGAHSPPALLAGALVSCVLGIALLRRLAARARNES